MKDTDEACAGELMRRVFLVIAPDDTLGEVAEKMADASAGSALVTESGRLTGILTSRDVLRAIAACVHPSEARVRDWMTPEPLTASPATPAEEAAYTMLAGGFHHLPVVEDERPIGLVGLRSVIGSLKPGVPGL